MREIWIPNELMNETWLGLRQLGGGSVEAAGIWGGTRTGDVEEVRKLYLLDHKSIRRHNLSHRVPANCLNEVFRSLRRDGNVIVADVHTHPSSWVGLSDVDKESPTEYRKGFVSVVIPHFGLSEPNICELGLHEYLGDGEWRELNAETTVRLRAL
jgi:hypothetical protein